MFQITEWRERYEVTDKGHVPKAADSLRAGPLRFIRSQVHGYSLGNGFRKLQVIAGDKKMEVFGIFHKLLELAGSSRIFPDSPDFSRRGILRVTPNGEPASIDDLAFLLDIPVKQVAYAVKVLTDKRLRWLQEIPEKSGKSREKSAAAESLLEPSTNNSQRSTNNDQPTTDASASCQNTIEFRLSVLLFDLIKHRKPDYKKPNLQAWAKHIDLMIRRDNRKSEIIEAVIRWVQKDVFWQNNILSTVKLRKQFDQLELKMNVGKDQHGTKQTIRGRNYDGLESDIGETIDV